MVLLGSTTGQVVDPLRLKLRATLGRIISGLAGFFAAGILATHALNQLHAAYGESGSLSKTAVVGTFSTIAFTLILGATRSLISMAPAGARRLWVDLAGIAVALTLWQVLRLAVGLSIPIGLHADGTVVEAGVVALVGVVLQDGVTGHSDEFAHRWMRFLFN